MTQRSPLYVRVPQREWPRELLTWAYSGPQLGIQPTPFIQRQWDWPNPPPARTNQELRTWIDALPARANALTLPYGQKSHWPNPVLPVATLRGWTVLPQLANAVSQPFNQFNWPNPGVAPENLELRTWVEGLPQTSLALTLPQRQTEWPNPTLRVQNHELRTWFHAQQLTPATVIPFGKTDWPNPQAFRRNQDLSWASGLPSGQIALTLPPRQPEWPNPLVARPNLDLRTWVRSAQLTATIALPFSQFDWPNPLARRASLELRTWTDGLPQQALALTVPPGQRDWPVPPARPNLALRGFSFSLQIQPVLPFNRSDWPNPGQKSSNVELRAWARGVPPSINLVPVRPMDWANPARRAYALFEAYPNLLGTLAPPSLTPISGQSASVYGPATITLHAPSITTVYGPDSTQVSGPDDATLFGPDSTKVNG